ncbi:hypothetical protein BJ170DRAFT_685140 [Xylariales sp. AK1849]|nr:hypothetical protein BJ170DRAFT_685140 [Xylariales sp. AK1849]
MGEALICSSTRKRPDWASLVPALLQDNTLRWKETSLETHDITIPLPAAAGLSPHSVFRAILLSPTSIGLDDTSRRIERLFNLNGGQYVAIVLLMVRHGQENSTAVLMRLQLELVGGGVEMPIIPVPSVEAVPMSLLAFHHQLCTSAASRRRLDPARSLLPYCSATQPLPDHVVNVLSDITTDMKDLIKQATMPEGHQTLTEYLGQDAERVIKFWKEEYLVD